MNSRMVQLKKQVGQAHRTQPARGWFLRGLTAVLTTLLIAFAFCTQVHAANKVEAMSIEQFDQTIGSEKFSGLVVAIASWCRPCKEELPDLSRLHTEYNGQGIRIIAVSLDIDSVQDTQELVNRLKIAFPVYWVGNKAITHYKIFGVPTTMVVKKGRIVERIPGQMSRKVLEDRIRELLKQIDDES